MFFCHVLDPGLNRDQNDARRAAWLRMQDQMNADAEQYKAKLVSLCVLHFMT